MLKSKFSLLPKSLEEEEAINEQDEQENAPTTPTTVVDEEDKDHIPVRRLNKSEVSVRLSWLGKTAEGDGYTYLKASLTGLLLTDIDTIKCFTHLQFVDVSDNSLTLNALQVLTELPYILLIHADKNMIFSAALNRCKYLQVIILNYNKLITVEDVFQPELSTLEVGFNKITEISFIHRMESLRVLDFRYNLIRDISNINFPNLDSLYLAGNRIKVLSGIETLQNLRVLHVRNNPIKLLNGFETNLPKLKYLNLRNCKVATLIQVKKLRLQTGLETLILRGTPYMGGEGKEDPENAEEEEDPETRVEVLAALPRLQRLNKGVFTPEEREEAKELMTQWLEDGEKDEEEEVVEEHAEEEQQPQPEEQAAA